MSNTIYSYNLSFDYQGAGCACCCGSYDNLTSLSTIRGPVFSNFQNSLNTDNIRADIERIIEECKTCHKRKALAIPVVGLVCLVVIIVIGVNIITTCNGFGCEMPGIVTIMFGTILTLAGMSFSSAFITRSQKLGQAISTAIQNYFKQWKYSRQDKLNVYIYTNRQISSSYHRGNSRGSGHVTTSISQETITIQIVNDILSGKPQGNGIMLYASGDMQQEVQQNQPMVIVQQPQNMQGQYGQPNQYGQNVIYQQPQQMQSNYQTGQEGLSNGTSEY